MNPDNRPVEPDTRREHPLTWAHTQLGSNIVGSLVVALVLTTVTITNRSAHTLTYAICAIVALTSIWVGFDSHRLRISSSKKPYSWNSGFLAWFSACLLLWIIVFPVYLLKRAKILKERGTQSPSSTWTSLLGTMAIIAAVLCIAAPFLGWTRLSIDDLRDQVSTKIQSTWSSDPTTQNVKLKSLILVQRSGNEYTGLLIADVSGKEEQHIIDVTYDGTNILWRME
jgi:hypothetical protein